MSNPIFTLDLWSQVHILSIHSRLLHIENKHILCFGNMLNVSDTHSSGKLELFEIQICNLDEIYDYFTMSAMK